MNKIYTIEEIPVEEKIYLSKDRFGWRVVHPIRNEDGSLNWFSFVFGSWNNILMLLFILFLLGIFFFAYHEVASQLTSCLAKQTITDISKNISLNIFNP